MPASGPKTFSGLQVKKKPNNSFFPRRLRLTGLSSWFNSSEKVLNIKNKKFAVVIGKPSNESS